MYSEVTAATAQGGRPYQEDRWVCARTSLRKGGRLLAVMDGHCGVAAADRVSQSLEKLLNKHLAQTRLRIEEVLRRTVADCANLVENEESGATLSMAYLPDQESRAFVAILGDSPVIVVDDKDRIWISPEHNVRSNLEERTQALQRGGVYEEGYLIDPRTGQGLQMSRVLGDRKLARFLNREPEMAIVPLGPKSIVIVATDGVFDPGHADARSLIEQAVGSVQAGMDAQGLVDWALQRGSPDNATALVWRNDPS